MHKNKALDYFTCPSNCSECFKTEQEAQRHNEKEHAATSEASSSTTSFPCPSSCGEFFPTKRHAQVHDAYVHIGTTEGFPACYVCQIPFASRQELEEHKEIYNHYGRGF